MSQLIRLQDIQAAHHDLIGDDYYDPTDKTAFGINEEKIGKIDGALVESTTGRIRYLIVDVGGWFSSKEVLVPAGLARIVGDDVFFDSLTKSQVAAMEQYDHDYQYNYKEQHTKDRHAFIAKTIPSDERIDIADTAYDAPNTLERLEERLTVNKDHLVAELVTVGKHVVTKARNIEVELEEEQAHIERTTVNRLTERRIGNHDDTEIVDIQLAAERAHVGKQTYVTEEINVGKIAKRHGDTVVETVQGEELDVDHDGNVVDAHGTLHENVNKNDANIKTAISTHQSGGYLELLEERPVVNKERLDVGTVTVTKHTRTKTIDVPIELVEEYITIQTAYHDAQSQDLLSGDYDSKDILRHVEPSLDSKAVVTINGTQVEIGDEPVEIVLSRQVATVTKDTYTIQEVAIHKTVHKHTDSIAITLKHEALDVTEKGFLAHETVSEPKSSPK